MLRAVNIRKGFGDLQVLSGISLDVEKGQVVALIGPSGSGKSTFLRCVNRLERIDSGEIWLDDDYICRMENDRLVYAPDDKLRAITLRMGMVFQNFNLFPHMSVMDNLIIAPMKVKHVSKKEAVEKAQELLDKVGLGDRGNQYPYQLSGGQAQRVAIARAL